jgi:ligand-binding sensor domain-containing protein
VPAAVDQLGASGSGAVIAIADGKAYEITAGRIDLRILYAVGDEPTSTGAVSAVAPRLGGGAWIAAERGLFVVDGFYVTRSPVDTGMGRVHQAADVEAGPLAGLWLASDDGLYRMQLSSFDHFVVPGIDGGARGVAVDADGEAVLVILDGKLVLLTLKDGKLLSELAPPETGAVVAVAAGKGMLFAVTETGLWRWRAGAAVPWTHFSGARGTRALAVAAASNTVWVRGAADVLELEGDTLTAHEAPAPEAGRPAAMALDGSGDLWVSRGADAVRFKVGCASTGLTFDKDVKPWITGHCAQCHSDFTSPDVFTTKADAALARVSTGDMPRCTGGVPCPADQRLDGPEYAVLSGWIRCGRAR